VDTKRSGRLALPLRLDQLHKLDPLGLIRRGTGSPLGEESTAVDVTRLAIQQVEEIFL
jgi:hypothetical protein